MLGETSVILKALFKHFQNASNSLINPIIPTDKDLQQALNQMETTDSEMWKQITSSMKIVQGICENNSPVVVNRYSNVVRLLSKQVKHFFYGLKIFTAVLYTCYERFWKRIESSKWAFVDLYFFRYPTWDHRCQEQPFPPCAVCTPISASPHLISTWKFVLV